MESRIHLGKNRTGLKASPHEAAELLEGLALQDTLPRPVLGAEAIRAQYPGEADAVGSMPPPTSVKGMIGTVADTLKGNRLHILLDKLGQRAAYERTGTRLYDAALVKAALQISLPEGMSLQALQDIRDDEAAHFVLLTQAIEALGGDGSVQTPCADISGVQGMGLMQAINEPRATFSQALETLLAAELIDQASWEMLIATTRQLGYEEWATRFESALESENMHLAKVRMWLDASLEADATVGAG